MTQFGIWLYEGRGGMRFVGLLDAHDREVALTLARTAAGRR
jgi:hypothetical protein